MASSDESQVDAQVQYQAESTTLGDAKVDIRTELTKLHDRINDLMELDLCTDIIESGWCINDTESGWCEAELEDEIRGLMNDLTHLNVTLTELRNSSPEGSDKEENSDSENESYDSNDISTPSDCHLCSGGNPDATEREVPDLNADASSR